MWRNRQSASGELVKVEASTVTKLLITDLMGAPHNLDPVTVIIEDLGVRAERDEHKTRQGKIIIECYGESWSYYWGSMGDRTVAQFFTGESVDYLAGCLRRGTSMECTVFSGEALAEAVRHIVVQCRRGRETYRYECGSLDREDARKLYDKAGDLSGFDGPEALMHSKEASDLLTELFTDEWHHSVSDLAFVPNPSYLYLCRIIAAVQAALRTIEPMEAVA